MSPELLIPLEYLPRNELAEVVEVHGEPAWTARMAELGLRPGCQIKVLRHGSPCLLLVGNARLSLRGDWAMQVLVRPVVCTV